MVAPTNNPSLRLILTLLRLTTAGTALSISAQTYDQDVRPLIQQYCVECHGGSKTKGGVDFTTMDSAATRTAEFETWATAVELLRTSEMPPDAAKQPSVTELDVIYGWYQDRFVDSVKPRPAPFKPRRLSAREYRNTLHSLFGFKLEVAVIEAEQTETERSLVMKLLPTDPPGRSGFQNDTHGNPLTPGLWEQYSYLADQALDRLFSPNRVDHLESFTGPLPESEWTKDNVTRLLDYFLTASRRRPSDPAEVKQIVDRVMSNERPLAAIKEEIKIALMSPSFLYRGLLLEGAKDKEILVDEFELAERLSYFLWGDMPDGKLLDLAADHQLRAQLSDQVDRMIHSPKLHDFVEDFATQWLALDAMNQFSRRQVPLAVALKSQPIKFIAHLIRDKRPLMELVDSKTTFANPLIAKFYRPDASQIQKYRKSKGIELEIIPLTKISLEKTPGRGGLITMPGILAMNKGPIQRGSWMLERILGIHLPDPPPDVGQVEPNRPGEELSFRQRFEQHRAKASCAGCHNKIDPLGFALESYNDQGAYQPTRKPDSQSKDKQTEPIAIDTSGQLPGGETFANFQELKQLLLQEQREPIVRNLVKQMLAYALCRKLEIYDQPTVNEITRELVERNGTWPDLIHAIAHSLPFQQTVVKGTKS